MPMWVRQFAFYGASGGSSGHSKSVGGGAAENGNGDKFGGDRFVLHTKLGTLTALTDDQRETLYNMYKNGDELVRRIYDALVPNGGAVTNAWENMTGAFFRSTDNPLAPDEIAGVRYTPDSDFIRNAASLVAIAGDTWFHEHGHYIAYIAETYYGINLETNAALAKAFDEDVKELAANVKAKILSNSIEGTGITEKSSTQDVIEFILDMTDTFDKKGAVGIQDVLGGKYQKQIGWGHKPKYWKDQKSYHEWKSGQSMTRSQIAMIEGVASMFAASFYPGGATEWKSRLSRTYSAYTGLLTQLDAAMSVPGRSPVDLGIINPDGTSGLFK